MKLVTRIRRSVQAFRGQEEVAPQSEPTLLDGSCGEHIFQWRDGSKWPVQCYLDICGGGYTFYLRRERNCPSVFSVSITKEEAKLDSNLLRKMVSSRLDAGMIDYVLRDIALPEDDVKTGPLWHQ